MVELPTTSERSFRYEGTGRDGRRVRDTVSAPDERSALRQLSDRGLVVTRLAPATIAVRRTSNRGLQFAQRVLLVRQLALMLKARVSLLEALHILADGLSSDRARRQFEAVIAALKEGAPFGRALRTHAPGFPSYLYAMCEVGEATGHLGAVLNDGAEQMAYEDRLRREFVNALTYPAFLACSGLAAVVFIFVEVVPRFSTLIGPDRGHMPMMSRALLATGEYVNGHLPLLALAGGALVAAVIAAAASPAVQRAAYRVGHAMPVVGAVLKAREIAAWGRLTAFALKSGVPLLEAARLSRDAAPWGRFRAALEAFETDLRAGLTVDMALGRSTLLRPMDLSLLRVGQRSGELPEMFGFLAEAYEAQLKDTMKQMTALLEPIAIGLISIIVGTVALSLVMALTSVYDTV